MVKDNPQLMKMMKTNVHSDDFSESQIIEILNGLLTENKNLKNKIDVLEIRLKECQSKKFKKHNYLVIED